MRALSATLLMRRKAAARQAIQDAGGLSEAAAITGLSTTHLSRCQSAHHPDVISAQAMLALTEHCGTVAFADCLAGLSGHRLSALEDSSAATSSVAAAIDALSGAAELAHVIGQSLSDGVISPSEQIVIRRCIVDVEHSLSNLKRALPLTGKPLSDKKKGRS